MIERNLEDILSDVKYLDPLFLSQLQETLREIFDGKQKALSPEEAWKKCTAFFDNNRLSKS